MKILFHKISLMIKEKNPPFEKKEEKEKKIDLSLLNKVDNLDPSLPPNVNSNFLLNRGEFSFDNFFKWLASPMFRFVSSTVDRAYGIYK